MYVVVIFKVDNTVTVVPTCWLTDGMAVLWPQCSATKRNRACKKGLPYKGTTEKLDIEVYGFAQTYKAAILKELEAVRESFYVSHNDTVAMLKRPRRAKKRPHRVTMQSSSSDDCSSTSTTDIHEAHPIISTDEEEPCASIPPPPPTAQSIVSKSLYKPIDPLLQSTMVGASSQEQLSSISSRQITPRTLNVHPTTSYTPPSLFRPSPQVNDLAYNGLLAYLDNAFLKMEASSKRVTDLLLSLNQRLLIVESKVDRCCSQTGSKLRTGDTNLPLPLKTKEEFLMFDKNLNKEDTALEFKSALGLVRGHSLGQYIRNAMCRLVTIDLARLMNVSGLNGKLGIKGTNILRQLKSFLDTDSRFIGYEGRQVNQIIRDWLHNSTQRGSIDVRRSEPRMKQHIGNNETV